MPTYEAFLRAEAGEIKLGGCCELVGGPKYYCHDCKNEWNKEQAIDAAYAKIQALKASVGGYFGDSYYVDIDIINRSITWQHYNDNGLIVGIIQKNIRKVTVTRLIEELKPIDLLNWKAHYENQGVLDGTQWSVRF